VPTRATAAIAAVGVHSTPSGDPQAPTPYPIVLAAAPPGIAEATDGDGHEALLGPQPPTRRRRDLWLWLGLIALLVAAAAAAAIYLLTAPNQVGVPAVVGKQLSTAQTSLKRAGFKVKISHARSTKAAGLVIRQNPAGRAQANQGSTVSLTVSAGPGNVIVPNVAHKPLAQAESAIRHAGLKVGKVQPGVDTSVPAGDVSSTSPFAGETEPLGTSITVYVSSGPGTKAVPPVIGDTEAAASTTLQNDGFSVGVSTRTTSSAPAGTVVAQSPAANSQASPGSTVTIVVALKPPPTKVAIPGVTGDTAAAARSALIGAGFSVSETTRTVTNKSSNGIVLAQSPPAGARANKGTTVTIVVGTYKQPTTTTTKTSTTPTTPTTTTPKGGAAARVQ
jgi:eukaryotic-like serine/threonine-protein kinase